MSGNEHQLARARPREINFQMVRRPCRLAVLVRAQNGEVERPARKLEVIGIAAERRDIGFRREHQPHVVVALVLIEKILASLIEGHGLAFERAFARARPRLLAGLFEGGQCALARIVGGLVGNSRDGLGHGRGDVFSRHQNVRHLGLAPAFVLGRCRGEAVLQQAVLLRGQLAQAGFHAVMIGENQSLRRYERGRAVGQPDRGEPHVIQPRGGDIGPVRLLDGLGRKIIEGPHAFVRPNPRRRERGDSHQQPK